MKNILKKKNTKNYFVPVVFDRFNDYERCTDIFSRLLKDRIIFLSGAIDDQLADIIIAQLLFLESQSDYDDIFLYINSPGGVITAGLAIYDTMQLIAPDVNTICIGQASSMGAFLLAAGTKGKRFCLPNSRILIHQPSGGFEGQVSDIQIHTEEIIRTKEKLIELMSLHTGQTKKQILIDTERDTYLDAYSAIDYGIIDDVLKSRKKNNYFKLF